jgi:hypothetical protein
VKVGALGVRLVLRATAELRGRVLIDEGVPATELSVGLELEEDGRSAPPWDGDRSTGLEADGSFVLQDVLAGTHRLTVRTENAPELATREGIRVVPNAATELEPIDLRGHVFAHELVLVPPEPRDAWVGQVRIAPAGREPERWWRTFRANPVHVVTPHSEIDVELSVQGFRTECIERVRGRREVRLRDALLVRLLLRTDGVLPAPPTRVKAVLVPADADPSRIASLVDQGQPAFDERREVLVRSPHAGALRVQWVVERGQAGAALATLVDVEPAQSVVVADVLGEQVLAVEISAAELERIAR